MITLMWIAATIIVLVLYMGFLYVWYKYFWKYIDISGSLVGLFAPLLYNIIVLTHWNDIKIQFIEGYTESLKGYIIPRGFMREMVDGLMMFLLLGFNGMALLGYLFFCYYTVKKKENPAKPAPLSFPRIPRFLRFLR